MDIPNLHSPRKSRALKDDADAEWSQRKEEQDLQDLLQEQLRHQLRTQRQQLLHQRHHLQHRRPTSAVEKRAQKNPTLCGDNISPLSSKSGILWASASTSSKADGVLALNDFLAQLDKLESAWSLNEGKYAQLVTENQNLHSELQEAKSKCETYQKRLKFIDDNRQNFEKLKMVYSQMCEMEMRKSLLKESGTQSDMDMMHPIGGCADMVSERGTLPQNVKEEQVANCDPEYERSRRGGLKQAQNTLGVLKQMMEKRERRFGDYQLKERKYVTELIKLRKNNDSMQTNLNLYDDLNDVNSVGTNTDTYGWFGKSKLASLVYDRREMELLAHCNQKRSTNLASLFDEKSTENHVKLPLLEIPSMRLTSPIVKERPVTVTSRLYTQCNRSLPTTSPINRSTSAPRRASTNLPGRNNTVPPSGSSTTTSMPSPTVNRIRRLHNSNKAKCQSLPQSPQSPLAPSPSGKLGRTSPRSPKSPSSHRRARIHRSGSTSVEEQQTSTNSLKCSESAEIEILTKLRSEIERKQTKINLKLESLRGVQRVDIQKRLD